MTNVPAAKLKILPKIADHQGLLISMPMRMEMTPSVSRCGWVYNQARWSPLRRALQEEDWSFIFRLPIDDAVERFQYTILAKAREYIPMRWFC